MTSTALTTAVMAAAQDTLAVHWPEGRSLVSAEAAAVRRAANRSPGGERNERGDYSSPIALRLARATGARADRGGENLPPNPVSNPATDLVTEFAADIASRLRQMSMVARVEIAASGFLNIWLTREYIGEIAGRVVKAGRMYGVDGYGLGHGVGATAEPAAATSGGEGRTATAAAVGSDCGGGAMVGSSRVVGGIHGCDADDFDRGAVRYWLARGGVRFGENRLCFEQRLLDDEDMTRRVPDNPYFSVCHAAARAAAVSRYAAATGVTLSEGYGARLLDGDCETDLLLTLGEFPENVAVAVGSGRPIRLTRYLETLAASYHDFHARCRVIPKGDERITERMRSLLWLTTAARVVLVNGLGFLGVNAPERI